MTEIAKKAIRATAVAFTAAAAATAFSFTSPAPAFADCEDPESIYCLDTKYSPPEQGCMGTTCDSQSEICCL